MLPTTPPFTPPTAPALLPTLLHSPLLAALNIPHAFTTRLGGCSTGAFSTLNFGNPSHLPADQRDPPATINANIARTLHALNLATRELVQVHQVHGTTVHLVNAHQPAHPQPDTTKADVLLTADPARVLAVRVADCVPILLASTDGAIVAAIHAGWRGVVAGAVLEALHAMRTLGAQSIHAAIGPCIGAGRSNHFVISADVIAEFAAIGIDADPLPHQPGKACIHLQEIIQRQLRSAGVLARHIDTIELCTVARPDLFFSHRRDAGTTGRMLGLIGPRAA